MTKLLRMSVRKWRKLALYANVEIRYKISNPLSFEKQRIFWSNFIFSVFLWILFVWIFLRQCSVYDIYHVTV